MDRKEVEKMLKTQVQVQQPISDRDKKFNESFFKVIAKNYKAFERLSKN